MKALKIYIFLFTISLFWSCQNESYFEFDEVDYYFKNISEDEIHKIIINEKRTDNEKEFLGIIEGNSPKVVSEEYSKRLILFGYKKVTIDKDKNEQLNNIFSENNCNVDTVSACVPVYRDIFIFKNNNKTIGIAKICFGCRLYHVVGTNKNLNNFGQCGDFDDLEKLIK